MIQKGSKCRLYIITAVIISSMAFSAPLLAQQDDVMAGRVAGEQDARANMNGTAWFFISFVGGCISMGIGGLVGVVGAYAWEPVPPSVPLIGKSPGYASAYTEAYIATVRRIQTSNAWTGFISSAMVWVVLIVLSSVEG